MKILDENDNEIFIMDYDLGYLTPDEIVIQHHDAVEEVEEQWHYEVIAEYPNGGKDVKRVIDVPGQKAMPAYDETEEIMRWHPYSPEKINDILFGNLTREQILDLLLGDEVPTVSNDTDIADVILGDVEE